MKKCSRVIAPATPGNYELHTMVSGKVTVSGDRAVNGTIVTRWTHSQLVGMPPPDFPVAAGQRHVVQVLATFAPDSDENARATVDLKLGGATLGTCDLTRAGNAVSSMSIVTASTI